MHITLDQARALVAFATQGSFAKAGKSLGLAHTGVIYSISSLESSVELSLLDRSGYRTQLTPMGKIILGHCEQLLRDESELKETVLRLRSEFEPDLKVVIDGVLPTVNILKSCARIQEDAPDTQVSLFTDFLTGVEATALKQEASFALSLLPLGDAFSVVAPLRPVPAVLVAHRSHPLVQDRQNPWTQDDLWRHTFLTVHGSHENLDLATLQLERKSTLHLSDFAAKKTAIALGMGYGWMPEYLILEELASGELHAISWQGRNRHEFQAHLYRNNNLNLGKAAQRWQEYLLAYDSPRSGAG